VDPFLPCILKNNELRHSSSITSWTLQVSLLLNSELLQSSQSSGLSQFRVTCPHMQSCMCLYWGHSRDDGITGFHLLPTAVSSSSTPLSTAMCWQDRHGYHDFEHSCKQNGYIGRGGGRDRGNYAGAECTAFHGRQQVVNSWISFCSLSSLQIITFFCITFKWSAIL